MVAAVVFKIHDKEVYTFWKNVGKILEVYTYVYYNIYIYIIYIIYI